MRPGFSARAPPRRTVGPGQSPNGDFEILDTSTQSSNSYVCRFSNEGALKTSFGTSGCWIGGVTVASAAADGDALIVGATDGLYRISTDGSLDTSFGGTGSVAYGPVVGSRLGVLPSMILSSEGTTIVAGPNNGVTDMSLWGQATVISALGRPNFVVADEARTTLVYDFADGSQTGFDVVEMQNLAVVVTTPIRSQPPDLYIRPRFSAARQRDGSLLVPVDPGGVVWVGANGLDFTFGTNGVAAADAVVYAIAQLDDGSDVLITRTGLLRLSGQGSDPLPIPSAPQPNIGLMGLLPLADGGFLGFGAGMNRAVLVRYRIVR